MIRFRRYGGIALLLLAALIVAQIGISFLVRTHRMRSYLIAHLESAFGRPVEVGRLSVEILPMPELDLDGVTIGEDPAFGHEYFLRAEQMAARFRWLGILRGHFEFGTMSLTRPSLILVRNAAGRWNLEGWLPPARASSAKALPVSPAPPAESTHRLQKIDIDEGRINFKFGDDKQPFAFTGVSGSIEQVSPGRWELRLEAQPWRSGVTLQSTGTLYVVGDVAGTSARLQPAQIRLHWEKVSLADLFRMVAGNDYGVRGEFALDGNASVGTPAPSPNTAYSPWKFALQARAAQIHRWDLTERADNPRVNVNVNGQWDVAAGEARAEELRIELPASNLSGSAVLETSGPANWRARFKSIAIQCQDLLAWYRAFQPGIAEEVSLNDQITGNLSGSGWPLRWDDGAIEGTAGALRIPGMPPARIDPFHGLVRDGKFAVENVRLRLSTGTPAEAVNEKSEKGAARPHAVPSPENFVETSLLQDSVARQGALRLTLRLAHASPLFKLTAAFGHPLNKGWEYTGGASGLLEWKWGSSLKDRQQSGAIDLTKAQLQVAGLNEPLKVEETRLEWKEGLRSATIGKVDGFGAAWSGAIAEANERTAGEGRSWRFQLHADHLDAAELDRWVGPRARPNWLQRLLGSLLAESNASAQASELLRRVSAEGEVSADTITIEKFKLANARAKLALQALHLEAKDVEAQWAGGTVRGEVQASFSPLPKYEVNAEAQRVNLSQLPWPARWAERWKGAASGKIHLTTGGVGKEELLKALSGDGQVKLNKIEFRGWDVDASTEAGTARAGLSRWATGEGEFGVGGGRLTFDAIRLGPPEARTQLAGTVSFGMEANLTFEPQPRGTRGSHATSPARELRVSGPLETPRVVVQNVSAAGKQQ